MIWRRPSRRAPPRALLGLIDECFTFVTTDTGAQEAQEGKHDERVLAAGSRGRRASGRVTRDQPAPGGVVRTWRYGMRRGAGKDLMVAVRGKRRWRGLRRARGEHQVPSGEATRAARTGEEAAYRLGEGVAGPILPERTSSLPKAICTPDSDAQETAVSGRSISSAT